MATVTLNFDRPRDQFDGIGSAFPQSIAIAGSNFPVDALAFDASANEACATRFKIKNYGSGNITAIVTWCADSATSGDVVWGAAIAAITPETDTQDISTDAFATENTVTDTHLGTTARREMNATITISNLDSVAANDLVVLRIRRLSSGNTMTGDAWLLGVELQYSD
jgi:hypothetical protein